MPAAVRLTKKELVDLIEETEAAGNDTTELRSLLAEVEERRWQPARREAPPEARLGETTTEEYLAEKRDQSEIEYGTGLECMICHDKFDHLLSGTCEVCFREWMLSAKPKGWRPTRPPRGVELRAELTTEERLNREAGDLFPGGVSGNILAMCIEYDRKYSLKELKTMCVEAGLSPSGYKKLLAAKLIAYQWEAEGKKGARAASTI